LLAPLALLIAVENRAPIASAVRRAGSARYSIIAAWRKPDGLLIVGFADDAKLL
jgi:hypothetical protein